ncbi:hypothetical protein N9H39_10830 [Gammaproteobacteria bacterium]|nr:hypothetical protein [Gammaproteobacteria bacterium]
MVARVDEERKYLRIRMNHANAGFFAYVTFVVNQILYCERENLVPVVDFGKFSGRDNIRKSGINAFYDPEFGNNTWEYFFEPVAGVDSSALNEIEAGLQAEGTVVELDRKQLWNLHMRCEDSVFNYPYGLAAPIADSDNPGKWYEEQRTKARRVMERYIRVKPQILDKVSEFQSRYLDRHHVLGIHMRGTDKGNREPDSGRVLSKVAVDRITRIVKPEEYFYYIDLYLKQFPESRIFLATDQVEYVELFERRYRDRVITRNVLRGTGFGIGTNVFQKDLHSGYLMGEEVLIDCLLLSSCDFLIKCSSAVGEYAVYFNKNLKCFDINHHDLGSFPFASRGGSGVRAGHGAETRPKLGVVVNYFCNNTEGMGYELVLHCTELALRVLSMADRVNEILVVDGSESNDENLARICLNLNAGYYHAGFKLTYVERYNLGWRILRETNSYIGLMANDVVPYPVNTLDRLCEMLGQEDIGCAFPYMFTCRQQVDEIQRPGFLSRGSITCEPSNMTLNLNIFRREVLETVGGLDEHYIYGFNEPILIEKIRRNGFRVTMVGDTLVLHFDQLTKSMGQSDLVGKHYKADVKRWYDEYPEYASRRGIGHINFSRPPFATTWLTRLLWRIPINISSKKFRNKVSRMLLWCEPFLTRYPTGGGVDKG